MDNETALRKQAEKTLNERLLFEGLVSQLLATFVNLPSDEVDSEIETRLRFMGEFLEADRCVLKVNSSRGDQKEATYFWLSNQITPERNVFTILSLDWASFLGLIFQCWLKLPLSGLLLSRLFIRCHRCLTLALVLIR
jgi:hypothetical protein